MSSPLDPPDRRALLTLARAAIHSELHGDETLERVLGATRITTGLEEVRGSFVTLRELPARRQKPPGKLRGCIGTIIPEEPLYRNVIHNAVHSAFDDPRFPPIRKPDLDRIAIEVSALTPLQDVDGAESIVPGRDGVHLENGPSRAVFLPQVATEQGWGIRELLENLARKANLPRDGWKKARLRVFQAEVFGEERVF